MQTSSTSSTPQTSSLPQAATWEELSEKMDHSDSSRLADWIDSGLAELEDQLSGFVTPKSLKKSLKGDR